MNFADYTEQFRLAAVAWAEANGKADRLEHMRKCVLGEIVNRLEGPVSAREHEAHATMQYTGHVRDMVEARTNANIAKAKMESMRMRFDGWRTVNATKRAEMKVL